MRAVLISRDDCLRRLCRDTLAASPATLIPVTPDEPPPAADLYIWDWHPGVTLARLSAAPPSAAHVLAIGREDARDALAALPFPAVSLLLKPVNPDALRACLEQRINPRVGDLRHDRDAILDSLLETTLRLQEYDQDRMNFLARAVHDFRTPLTAVNGYCGMLLSGQLGPLTLAQQDVLGRSLHSIRRLSRLATALFQWSTGVRVGLQPHIREADIEECCRQALHEIRPLADEKNISVELDMHPPAQPLHFDAEQMEQLLVNLLENSCKFTQRGGYINVRGYSDFWERRTPDAAPNVISIERRRAASRRPNAYRMEVSDNGMGVRPEHLETIFQEYTSYGGGSDRSGSGLGLAICRRILAEHGGHIYAESGNKGVTFSFLLPFARAADSWDNQRGALQLVTETVGKERA